MRFAITRITGQVDPMPLSEQLDNAIFQLIALDVNSSCFFRTLLFSKAYPAIVKILGDDSA